MNVFATDTSAEIELVKELALGAGAFAAVESTHWCVVEGVARKEGFLLGAEVLPNSCRPLEIPSMTSFDELSPA